MLSNSMAQHKLTPHSERSIHKVQQQNVPAPLNTSSCIIKYKLALTDRNSEIIIKFSVSFIITFNNTANQGLKSLITPFMSTFFHSVQMCNIPTMGSTEHNTSNFSRSMVTKSILLFYRYIFKTLINMYTV